MQFGLLFVRNSGKAVYYTNNPLNRVGLIFGVTKMKSLRKQKKRFSLKEHKSQYNPKNLGCMIGSAVRSIIRNESRERGGLLSK